MYWSLNAKMEHDVLWKFKPNDAALINILATFLDLEDEGSIFWISSVKGQVMLKKGKDQIDLRLSHRRYNARRHRDN